MKNKEKLLLYFYLRIHLPIQIQLLDIENPKQSKIDFPNWGGMTVEQVASCKIFWLGPSVAG
jgi:hypothetical protein